MDLAVGLSDSWVSSSLKISPEQQTDFLQKSVDRKLPLSRESYDKIKKLCLSKKCLLAGVYMTKLVTEGSLIKTAKKQNCNTIGLLDTLKKAIEELYLRAILQIA